MADPLSIAGLVLAVGGAINALLSISGDARDALIDIQELHNELLVGLFTLKGAAQHFESQARASQWSSQQFIQMLQTAWDTIASLRRDLEMPQSRTARSTQRLTWHWKKDDVAKHLARIERIKAWFLIAMTADSLASNREVLLQMQALSLAVEQDLGRKTAELEEAKHKTLLQHLAPIGPETTHSKALDDHQPGTSNWFTSGPLEHFLDIDDKRGAILWLKGKSGSGKTTLLAHAIEYLKTQRQVAEVLSFYCSFDNSNYQTPLKILGSLIAQLSYGMPAIAEYLMLTVKAREGQGQYPNFSAMELEDVFIKHVSAARSIFVVIDAINESKMNLELESLFHRLAASCPTIRIIISSTVDRSFNHDSSLVLFNAEMNAHHVDDDIRVYIDSRLKNDETLSVLSEGLKQEIRDFVLCRSNGMFRYAQCQMDHLASQRTGRGVRRALSCMPSNLNETYERALNNIKNHEDRQLIQRALLWLAYSLRPLRLQELADVVIVEDDDDGIDDDIRLHDPRILLECSNGLLEYNPVTQTVSLGHSSIKTFLTSDWIRNSSASDFALGRETDCHLNMMRRCLTYLSFSEFSGGCGAISKRTIYRYPFLGYAAWNWPHHLRDPSSDDWNVISKFLSTRASERGGNYGSWIHALAEVIPSDIVKETQPLYYAASFGFTPLVEAILLFDDSVNLEAPGGRVGSTALQVACFRRQKEAAQVLVEAGADFLSRDCSFPDGKGLTSLWWAETNGWMDIVALMKSLMARATSTAPEDIYPTQFIREVQKADTKDMEANMQGRRSDLRDKQLTLTEIPRHHLSQSELEKFLTERFGKESFAIDNLKEHYLVTTYQEFREDDWKRIQDLRC